MKIFPVFFMAWAAWAQTDFHLQGRVLDAGLAPLENVLVSLESAGLSDLTDAEGRYELQSESHSPAPGGEPSPITLMGGILSIAPGHGGEQVSISLLQASGRTLFKKLAVASPGGGSFPIPAGSRRTSGLCLLDVQVGSHRQTWKGVFIGERFVGSGRTAVPGPRFKTAMDEAIDSLAVSASGYHGVTIPLYHPANEMADIILPASASETVFRQVFTGSGRVEDISTGDTVQLPLDQRIHILLLPEGYTSAEIDDGTYLLGVKDWFDDVFNFEPLVFFKQAFVIWEFPARSNEYIIDGRLTDTYFGIGISNWSMSDYSAAGPVLWGLMDRFPYPPEHFYDPGGRVSRRAKNIVAQFMVYEESRGRSGYSGLTTSLSNPDNSGQLIDAAFALNQQHELMHALPYLLDEYYEMDHGPLSDGYLNETSQWITNVSPTNLASAVPWRHLLLGGAHNPGVDSLVGAFGTNGRYHPEFKCLLNGSHDNSVLYGGDNDLRVYERLCNWCRELTAFRLYERTRILADHTSSWQAWVDNYRVPFYDVFGFSVPDEVPQTNSEGTPWFLPAE